MIGLKRLARPIVNKPPLTVTVNELSQARPPFKQSCVDCISTTLEQQEEDKSMKKIRAILLAPILFVHIGPTVSAKEKSDRTAVKALANQSIAVKTKTGETYYGLMQSADDSGFTVQIADYDDFTSQEVNFKRDEVAKVWRASLRFDQKNIAKGAWIGAGAGMGVSLIGATVKGAPRWCALSPFYGAAAGAVAGAFWKKKHKKRELVYSI